MLCQILHDKKRKIKYGNNKRFLVKTRHKKHIIFMQPKDGFNMNKVIKMLIKENIHNNIIVPIKMNTGDKYSIFDKSGNEILSVINGWATNHYSINVNNKNILAVKWNEGNERPLSRDQKDMLDIINAVREKIDLQETVQTMNESELETANFLQQSLCSFKH